MLLTSGVPSDYRYIFVSKTYVFYGVEDDAIRVINIYNEKSQRSFRYVDIYIFK